MFEQQNYYYFINNNKLEINSLEQLAIDKIINDEKQRYYLNNIYYSTDGQNIFKRVDRYRHKLLLIIIFSFLTLINIHEIIFNSIHLYKKIDPDNPDKDINKKLNNSDAGSKSKPYNNWNIFSEFLCDFYILTIHFLSFYIFCKFGIDTKIYY